MLAPVIIFLFFMLWYIHYRTHRYPGRSFKEKKYRPFRGEDALRAVRIVGVSNSVFSVAKYLRSVRNMSESQFVTVAVNQIITTTMGTTYQARLLENLAPGEERRLGHSDHVKDGKYQIYIGYEILWARYIPTPDWYTKPKKENHLIHNGYTEILNQHHNALIREMEEKKDLLS
ncbi:hypothetical protein DVR12_25055 [Chitinophaga silvatica]|uniref:Uncharacterized protein n=1 Tax=Chitinophaga silvatica TaxID=2282649 RepID=A0A3E1Y300_9BACT|nr:hypothetical protein [Chitinophaga silvatica]RFS19079.1 hypothetical protein DVR12_25055 [Chitinophaga silvatica]